MPFGSSFKRVMSYRSASHAWIELHRLVEAYCKTVATPFHDVFAALEARFDFGREPAKWPELATMRRAAVWLRDRRQLALTERASATAAQRAEKARGRRVSVPATLRASEAAVRGYVASTPQVGAWGWRDRRRTTRGCP